MLDSLMEGLGYIGSSLDKLGPRPMRGLLAGRPREALSFVPFSDEMGLTDPSSIASGRDVTDRFGWTRKGADDASSHAMGMLADVLIDPTAAAGTALGAARGVRGLSSMMKPSTMNPVHHLARLLGDPEAAGRLTDLSPMDSLRWAHENREGALKLIKPADYASMMKDEGTPIGRLHALADAAGVRVFPSSKLASTFDEAASNLQMEPTELFHTAIRQNAPRRALATWHPSKGMITANVVDHPEIWSDLKRMRQHQESSYLSGFKAAPYAEGTAVHEIGHALHPKVAEPDYLDWNTHLPKVEDDPDLWRTLTHDVSSYGMTNPREFVAEAFSKRGQVAGQEGRRAAGFPVGPEPPWLSPLSFSLYGHLQGPDLPPELIEKLKEYLLDQPRMVRRPMNELREIQMPRPAETPRGLLDG